MGYGNGADYQNQAASPARTPLIALEMDRQGKAVEHLHSLISDLEARLSGVLRSDDKLKEGVGVNAPQPPHPVPLAGGLSGQNVRIEGACARLQAIFDRIEL